MSQFLALGERANKLLAVNNIARRNIGIDYFTIFFISITKKGGIGYPFKAAIKRFTVFSFYLLIQALALDKKAKGYFDGEPPFDTFVRWKPIDQQTIGWKRLSLNLRK